MSLDFSAIRAAHPIVEYCRARGMELRRNGSACQFIALCPLHNEKTPSFTIYADDNSFHCYGCGAGGDVVDIEIALRGGTVLEAAARLGDSGAIVHVEPRAEIKRTEKRIHLPDLERPTEKDLHRLSVTRSIAVEPLAIAVERGFLWAFTDERNGRCWLFTDQRRRCGIRRRLDGKLFRLANGNETKSAASSASDMSAPLGYREARDFPCIAVQEGPPDSLAALAHAWASGVEHLVAPICMPSANANFTTEALGYLQGKRARIFGDADAVGKEAVQRWAWQLRAANVVVDDYDFTGLIRDDGEPVKDLNDMLRIDADCWERYRDAVENVMNFCGEKEK